MLQPAPADWSLEDAAHLINRAGFGAPPATLQAWHSLGRSAAVEKLLTPIEPPSAASRPAWFSRESYKQRAITVRNERMEIMASNAPEEEQKARQRQLRKVLQDRQQGTEAVGWWLDRLAATPSPLAEKMTLFWHGHFATSIEKVKDPYFMLQQNELFRTQALGNIRDLTKAVCRDPAMMVYLDTDQSVRTKPNENFAREIMELFTLGEGHYSEDDIKEAARAFTGLRINRLLATSFFHEPSWDSGPKSFLGRSGPFRSDDIVDILFQQEACPRFLSRKLCAFFISDTPSDSLVNAVADEIRRHDFAITPVLRSVFLSTEFYGPSHRRTQIKSPVQFLVQTRHALGLDSLPRPLQLGILQQLGQSLFRPPNVAGWDGGRAWITTNTLLTRYNISGFLVKGADSGYRPPLAQGRKPAQQGNRVARERLARALTRNTLASIPSLAPADSRHDRAALLSNFCHRLFQTQLSAAERRPFEEYLASQGEAPLTDKAVANLLHLMMSTPQFQLC